MMSYLRQLIFYLILFSQLISAETIEIKVPMTNPSGVFWGNGAMAGYHRKSAELAQHSVDIFAPAGRNVYLRIGSASSVTYFKVSAKGDVVCGDGKKPGQYLTIGIHHLAGPRIGTLHYAHLKDIPGWIKKGTVVSSGTFIGKVHNWPLASCYYAPKETDHHIHVEVGGEAREGFFGHFTGYDGRYKAVPQKMAEISNCGVECSGCVLGTRRDILPVFSTWGWNTSCRYHQRIVEEWCNIDPVGCHDVMNESCPKKCRNLCGNTCTHCILEERDDILPAFGSWGWSTRCNKRNDIVKEWCDNLDPGACGSVKAKECKLRCPVN